MTDHIPPIAAFALALFAALAMGFSIQRGGTCMVAAVDQLTNRKSGDRLLALLECSLWTSFLGLVALAAGLPFSPSPAYQVGSATLVGGLLLGAGAALNGACVFGSIARIGSRDWHYLLTLPGFFLGSLVHHEALGNTIKSATGLSAANWVWPVFLLLILSLASLIAEAWRNRGNPYALFGYRHATIVIGFAFVVLASISGPWTYTEVFARTAHGGATPAVDEMALFLALLGGAILGGSRAAAFSGFRIARGVLCFAGGALMGFGSSLIPGGNDNLILVGLPTLQPHAWLAIGAMVLAIAIGLNVERFWRRVWHSRFVSRSNST